MDDGAEVFAFHFEPAYRKAALLFGVTPGRARVVVDATTLTARFGPWRLSTPLVNVQSVSITGPYSVVKTIGPAHLSLQDRGLTMATNRRRGVCVEFHDPVRCMDPTGRLLRHPGLTVTVADCEALASRLRPGVAA
jgi:hypothetical protein